MFLFHEMGTFVHRPGPLSEILPPCPDHHDSASAEMVSSAEKSVEIVSAAIQGGIVQRLFPYGRPFQKGLPGEMKCLAIPGLRVVVPVEEPRDTGDPSQGGDDTEKQRGVEGWGNEQVWIAS